MDADRSRSSGPGGHDGGPGDRGHPIGCDVTQRAIAELQDAALEAARIRRGRGDLDAAETGIRQGLRLLDPADALYLQLAELESTCGHPDRVATLWRELRRRHATDTDDLFGLLVSTHVVYGAGFFGTE